MPVIISNIILQELDYFKSSTVTSLVCLFVFFFKSRTLRFQVATSIPGLENGNSNGNSLGA